MKPSEIIDIALTEVIPNESRWCTGRFRSYIDDQCCMLGALGFAATGSYTAASLVDRVHHPSLETACTQIELLMPRPYMIAADFNDEQGYDRVRELMEKARAMLEEQGL